MTYRILFLVFLSAGLTGCSGGNSKTPVYQYPAPEFKDDAPANRPLDREFPSVFVDKDGNTVDLKMFRGKKSVVVVVLRGVPQSATGAFCLNCLAQVSGLIAKKDEIAKRDAEVLILFPGSSDTVEEFINQARQQTDGQPGLSYPLVLDKDYAIIDRLDIRGDQAKPSTYILNKEGQLVYAYVGESISDRPSIKAVLKQLDILQNGK